MREKTIMKGKKVQIRMRGSNYDMMTGWVIGSWTTKNGIVHRVEFGESCASFHESVVFEIKKQRRKGR